MGSRVSRPRTPVREAKVNLLTKAAEEFLKVMEANPLSVSEYREVFSAGHFENWVLINWPARKGRYHPRELGAALTNLIKAGKLVIRISRGNTVLFGPPNSTES